MSSSLLSMSSSLSNSESLADWLDDAPSDNDSLGLHLDLHYLYDEDVSLGCYPSSLSSPSLLSFAFKSTALSAHSSPLTLPSHQPATPVSLDSRFNLSPVPLDSNNLSTPFTDRFPFSPVWIHPESYISPVIRSSYLGSPNITHRKKPIFSKSKNPSFLERLLASSPSPASTDSSPERPLAHVCRYQKSYDASIQTPPHSADVLALSPLTPLTPTTNTHVDLRIPMKRRHVVQEQDSPTPLPRNKKLRHSYPGVSPPSPSASSPASSPLVLPTFTTRILLDAHVDVSPLFPLFYRRFPGSSFFQPPSSEYTAYLHQLPRA
jgi:hypothetical protein